MVARVVLVGLPEVLGKVVERTISDSPAVEIAAEVGEADVFIVATGKRELRVVELADDGRRAYVWRSGERIALGELSPESLRKALA